MCGFERTDGFCHGRRTVEGPDAVRPVVYTRSRPHSSDDRIDAARLGRLLPLIGLVTAVSLLTSAQIFPSDLFSIAVVAIGSIALVTGMIGFLIAAGATYDDQMTASGR